MTFSLRFLNTPNVNERQNSIFAWNKSVLLMFKTDRGEKYYRKKCIKILSYISRFGTKGWFLGHYFRAAVAFLAASSRSTPLCMGKQEFLEICLALSTIVSSRVLTRGNSIVIDWYSLTFHEPLPLAIYTVFEYP